MKEKVKVKEKVEGGGEGEAHPFTFAVTTQQYRHAPHRQYPSSTLEMQRT